MPKFYPGDPVEIIGQDVKVPNLLTDGNVDGIDVSDLDAAVVKKALFDAQTILAAVNDDDPVALTIAASRILGRKSTGNIDDLTAAEVRTILSIIDGGAGTDTTAIHDNVGGEIVAITIKNPPFSDAEVLLIEDSAASWAKKRISMSGLRAHLISDTAYGAGWNGVTTIAPSKNAVYDKIETLGAGATLTVAETEVFNGTAPTAWTDLDLSGTIGANVALVLLKLGVPVSLGETAVRKNGDTDEFWATFMTASNTGYGAAFGYLVANVHQVLIVATDSAGKIEWKCLTAGDCTIDIIAYIK